MAFQKQARNIMNTHVVNSGLARMPAGMVLVFDSETGMVQDASFSVQDRAAYHRYLMLRASLASGSQDRPQEVPLRKKEQ